MLSLAPFQRCPATFKGTDNHLLPTALVGLLKKNNPVIRALIQLQNIKVLCRLPIIVHSGLATPLKALWSCSICSILSCAKEISFVLWPLG